MSTNKKEKLKSTKKHKKSYTKWKKVDGKLPGDKVQIDIKHVPTESILFATNEEEKYYQITAIDEFSRKRVLKIVKEKKHIRNI